MQDAACSAALWSLHVCCLPCHNGSTAPRDARNAHPSLTSAAPTSSLLPSCSAALRVFRTLQHHRRQALAPAQPSLAWCSGVAGGGCVLNPAACHAAGWPPRGVGACPMQAALQAPPPPTAAAPQRAAQSRWAPISALHCMPAGMHLVALVGPSCPPYRAAVWGVLPCICSHSSPAARAGPIFSLLHLLHLQVRQRATHRGGDPALPKRVTELARAS